MCTSLHPFQAARLRCADKFGNTPLHVAARYGHELLISTLMTSDAGYRPVSTRTPAPLLRAASDPRLVVGLQLSP